MLDVYVGTIITVKAAEIDDDVGNTRIMEKAAESDGDEGNTIIMEKDC